MDRWSDVIGRIYIRRTSVKFGDLCGNEETQIDKITVRLKLASCLLLILGPWSVCPRYVCPTVEYKCKIEALIMRCQLLWSCTDEWNAFPENCTCWYWKFRTLDYSTDSADPDDCSCWFRTKISNSRSLGCLSCRCDEICTQIRRRNHCAIAGKQMYSCRVLLTLMNCAG